MSVSSRILSALTALILSLGFSSFANAQLANAPVVISQVNGQSGEFAFDPSFPGSDFVVLFNRSSLPVDLTGWSVQIAVGNNTLWTKVDLPSFILQPKQYYLIQLTLWDGSGYQITGDTAASLSRTILSSSSGKVALCNNTTLLTGNPTCTAGSLPAAVVDFLAYGPISSSREPCSGTAADNAPPGVISTGSLTMPLRKHSGCQDTNNNALDFSSQQTFFPPDSTFFAGPVEYIIPRLSSVFVSQAPGGNPSGPIIFTAQYLNCADPFLNADVSADLAQFGGLFNTPMFDTGVAPDAIANDGIYSTSFFIPANLPPGDYSVSASASPAGGGQVSFVSTPLRLLPPDAANDTCPSALDLSSILPHTALYNNRNSGPDAGAPDCASLSYGLWFRYTPAADGELVIRETTSVNTFVSVFSSINLVNPCSAMTPLEVKPCQRPSATARFPVELGKAYLILVGDSRGSAAPTPTTPLDLAFDFNPAPSNDRCPGAAVIPPASLPFFDTVRANAATQDPDIPCNALNLTRAHAGIWYQFTPSSTGGLVCTDHSQNINACWALYTGTCGSLAQVACSTFDTETFAVAAGVTYHILLSHEIPQFSSGEFYEISFDFILPPSNDTCTTALTISSLPFIQSIDARAASDDRDSSCNSDSGFTADGVWLRYTPPVNQSIEIRETSDFIDSVIYVSEGNCNRQEQACIDAGDSLSLAVQAGRTYFIMIGQSAGLSAPPEPYPVEVLLVAAPPNDACVGAIPLPGSQGLVQAVATFATTDPDVSCNQPALTLATAGVWYSFTASQPGTLALNELADPEVVATLYTGSCAAMTEYACQNTPDDHFSFHIDPGTYFILISSDFGFAPFASYQIEYAFTLDSGACCIASVCSILTPAQCAAQAGSYLGDNAPCRLPAGSPVSYSNASNLPLTILDEAAVVSTITPAGPASDVATLEIELNIHHDFVGDLIATVSTGSTTLSLFAETGGSRTISGVYRFSDSASQTFAQAAASPGLIIAPGSYRAAGPDGVPLSISDAFRNLPVNTPWTLTLADVAAPDAGSLSAWSLSIVPLGPDRCAPVVVPCPGDFTGNRIVEVADIFAFLNAWFSQFNLCTGVGNCSADVNNSGAVEVADIFAFLNQWFSQFGQPCP